MTMTLMMTVIINMMMIVLMVIRHDDGDDGDGVDGARGAEIDVCMYACMHVCMYARMHRPIARITASLRVDVRRVLGVDGFTGVFCVARFGNVEVLERIEPTSKQESEAPPERHPPNMSRHPQVSSPGTPVNPIDPPIDPPQTPRVNCG